MDLTAIVLIAPVLLFSVIVHEYAHGYAALKQGDQTALMMGRLTMNPIKHIDPFLTILLPLILYLSPLKMVMGGAKPVPVNPRNYRNFKRGDIIVSLAGVTANLGLALICTILIIPLSLIASVSGPLEGSVAALQAMMILGVNLNLALIAFNLIPIPPLDGSHVMKYLLPTRLAVAYSRLGFLGLVIIVILINVYPKFLDIWFHPVFAVAGMLLDAVGRFVLPHAASLVQFT